jgi:hypothetical protein
MKCVHAADLRLFFGEGLQEEKEIEDGAIGMRI